MLNTKEGSKYVMELRRPAFVRKARERRRSDDDDKVTTTTLRVTNIDLMNQKNLPSNVEVERRRRGGGGSSGGARASSKTQESKGSATVSRETVTTTGRVEPRGDKPASADIRRFSDETLRDTGPLRSAGIALSEAVRAGEATIDFVKDPVKTTKQAGKGVAATLEQAFSGGFPEVGQRLKQDPGAAIGVTAGLFATGAGAGAAAGKAARVGAKARTGVQSASRGAGATQQIDDVLLAETKTATSLETTGGKKFAAKTRSVSQTKTKDGVGERVTVAEGELLRLKKGDRVAGTPRSVRAVTVETIQEVEDQILSKSNTVLEVDGRITRVQGVTGTKEVGPGRQAGASVKARKGRATEARATLTEEIVSAGDRSLFEQSSLTLSGEKAASFVDDLLREPSASKKAGSRKTVGDSGGGTRTKIASLPGPTVLDEALEQAVKAIVVDDVAKSTQKTSQTASALAASTPKSKPSSGEAGGLLSTGTTTKTQKASGALPRSVEKPRERLTPSAVPIVLSSPKSDTKAVPRQQSKPRSSQRRRPAQDQRPDTILDQDTSQKAATVTRQKQVAKPKNRQAARKTPRVTDSLLAPPIPVGAPGFDAGGVLDDFSVEVRRGDRFELLKSGLGAEDAFAAGLSEVRKSPRASFRLLSGGQEVDPADFGLVLPGDVRRSKRDSNVVVEKTAFRIDSPGELLGITGKGGKKRGKKGGGGLLGDF